MVLRDTAVGGAGTALIGMRHSPIMRAKGPMESYGDWE